jgi:16S rRNA (guanine(966)-N(2))-methyltransferase RsmD
MRVIAGKYRGRRLTGPQGLEIRPTGDRLKESLFNILAPALPGAVVLDAFGGTGAIGIEALSRGAREAVFIEKSPAGCRLIRRNLDGCGVTTGYRILEQDIFTALRFLARQGFRAAILFFDPPYAWDPYGDLLGLAFGRGLAREDASVIVEHRRRTPPPESGEGFSRTRLVRQGDHCLSFYAAAAPPAPALP